jgi:DNA polymerase type B, organellar and viral
MIELEDAPEFKPYHVKRGRLTPSKNDPRSPELRPFIVWDGEGINLDGPKQPQSYVLFGCSTGEYITAREHLHTYDLLEFMIRVGEANPDAFHVGFAFGYDGNMILRSLAPGLLQILHETGYVRVTHPEGWMYGIKFARGKWFQVTKTVVRDGRNRSFTVRIDDTFSFFGTGFKRAYLDYFKRPVPEIVGTGKDLRGSQSSIEDLPQIIEYWKVEIKCMLELVEELRRVVYGAGMRITRWHGPGELANHAMSTHRIKDHMKEMPDEIRRAARYAYASGRFELFGLGRWVGPIYGYDFNSAYPAGIARLPSFSDGTWHHESNPDRISEFGLHYVRLSRQAGFAVRPGPVFHRDRHGDISFPWRVNGWYYGPEALEAAKVGAEITEAWHYIPGPSRPFEWVRDMYELRRQWKREGKQSQLALKLCLNSMYGKTAQRVGWNAKKKKIPPFHQLEWAGWVTAFTRAKIYQYISRIPQEKLIAVETDGFYTTMSPEELGVTDSEELGELGVTVYDECIYLQNGLAWFRSGSLSRGSDWPIWTPKRRGLDPDSFKLSDARSYMRKLWPDSKWPEFVGTTHRFIGMGAALNMRVPLRAMHCRWVTNRRVIVAGGVGKRVHHPPYCDACQKGATAYEMPHTLVINPKPSMEDPDSHPHDIPWEDDGTPEPEWRKRYAELDEEFINVGHLD